MAFTLPQTRYFVNMLPVADGSFRTGDCGLIMGIYVFDLVMHVGVGGELTLSGAPTRALTAYRTPSGGLVLSGDATTLLTAYRSLGGSLDMSGSIAAAMLYFVSIGGELELSGGIRAANPAWLMIDEILAWQGEWDEAIGYNINDTVLYQVAPTAEWHVFVSKTGHNVGNIPTTSPANWRRLYQEQWL